MRFRGPARSMSEELVEAVGGLTGVQGCHRSTRTGSLLVTFDPNTITADAIAEAVVEHAGIGEKLVDLARDGAPRASNGQGAFAAGVTQTVSALDQQLQRKTRGFIGLSGLVPGMLILWAVRQIALGRANPLSWTSALWYAHGIFRDYGNHSEG
jgi:hypothetical protein